MSNKTQVEVGYEETYRGCYIKRMAGPWLCRLEGCGPQPLPESMTLEQIRKVVDEAIANKPNPFPDFDAEEYKKLYNAYRRAANKCVVYLQGCGVECCEYYMPDATDTDDCMCVAETLADVYVNGPTEAAEE